MAVFFVGVCLVSVAALSHKTGVIEKRGVLEGPDSSAFFASAQGAEISQPTALGGVLGGAFAIENGGPAGYSGATVPGAVSLGIAALRDQGSPVGPSFDRSGMISYIVRPGDSLGKIASYFGISIDTITSANPGVRANFLKKGQALNILPTSGVVYKARSGDTLQSISLNFGISQDKILQFNRSVNFANLDQGISVIIPGGKNYNLVASASSLPNFNKEFIIPTDGNNWGILHHYNAVDIANSCGTPVVASAEGLVVPDESMPNTLGGWNEGYGNFVLMEHPFGDDVKTRYSHLEKVMVQVGDYLKRGQTIGLMGQTGDATGCHVHFEVIGAQNPFAKR